MNIQILELIAGAKAAKGLTVIIDVNDNNITNERGRGEGF